MHGWLINSQTRMLMRCSLTIFAMQIKHMNMLCFLQIPVRDIQPGSRCPERAGKFGQLMKEPVMNDLVEKLDQVVDDNGRYDSGKDQNSKCCQTRGHGTRCSRHNTVQVVLTKEKIRGLSTRSLAGRNSTSVKCILVVAITPRHGCKGDSNDSFRWRQGPLDHTRTLHLCRSCQVASGGYLATLMRLA